MRKGGPGEIDIRSIKSTMKMDILRCKTPEMVEKEIWAYLLAYNLLRTVMAVAASENDVEPREISFKGAKQALTAFAPKLEAARPEQRAAAGGCDAQGGGVPTCWQPAGAVGAASAEAKAEARKRLGQPRRVAKLAHNQAKWY